MDSREISTGLTLILAERLYKKEAGKSLDIKNLFLMEIFHRKRFKEPFLKDGIWVKTEDVPVLKNYRELYSEGLKEIKISGFLKLPVEKEETILSLASHPDRRLQKKVEKFVKKYKQGQIIFDGENRVHSATVMSKKPAVRSGINRVWTFLHI